MPSVTFTDCAKCLVRPMCSAHYPGGSWQSDCGVDPCKVEFPRCECGREFAECDIGIAEDGPEDRTVFECPECGGIMEVKI